MNDGELGKRVSRGRYEENDIPGAKNESVAYDDKFYSIECFPAGTPTITGPNGVVTYFESDNQPVQTKEEYGKPEVTHEGDTICIVIARTKIVIQTGTFIVFDWYDANCFLTSVVLLKERSREQRPQERRTLLKPIKRCETDIPAWLIHKLVGLISSGASPAEIVKLLSGLMSMRSDSGIAGAAIASSVPPEEHRLTAVAKNLPKE